MNPPLRRLTPSELLQLKRWNTPTIYNGWEQITRHDPATDALLIGDWGVSFTKPRFSAKVSVNYTGVRRLAVVAPSAMIRANSYTNYAPQTRVDVAASYMINKRYTVYADARNLNGVPLRRGTWSEDTAGYARSDVLQFAGAMFTLGVRGQF